MNKRTEEFLERFKDFDNNDIKVIFGDIFSEFIEILNNADLSEKTLIYLNGIFEKDMFLFFVETSKNFISKQKVKDKIEEYFEDEEWLIEHDLRALCDDEKECREYYINKKIALKDIKKNILDKLNKLLNN